MAAKFKISGENASLFRLKKNKLSIRKQAIPSGLKWYNLKLLEWFIDQKIDFFHNNENWCNF